jgi:exodeoxyribonuclease VII large subunit
VARRPFNPDEALGGLFDQPPKEGPPSPSGPEGPLTPSGLNERIKRLLESGLQGPIEVLGELSNLNRRGHWYFALKDESSVLSCVLWRSDAARVDFEPTDGQEVLVSGRVSHWVPGGRTQFYVTSMKRKGLGTLEERFQALCDELRQAGYFDDARKQPLPSFPRRIAVVTSASGAAIEDVRRTASSRLPGVELLVVDVRVQGETAAPEIARAIDRLDAAAEQLGIDAILVTRGGGSREDLWAFNERVVADATFRCRTPLVAAIGHEVDTSVIELIADLRASTPTQAAVHLVPDATELEAQVDYLADRLRTALRTRMNALRQRFEQAPRTLTRALRGSLDRRRLRVAELTNALESNRPAARVSAARARVSALHGRLGAATTARVRQAGARLEAGKRQLESVGPRAVLARGYAWTLDDSGRLVRSIEDVPVGARLTTILGDGRLQSTVKARQSRSDMDQTSQQE